MMNTKNMYFLFKIVLFIINYENHGFTPPPPPPCNKFLPVLLWNLFEEKREIRSIYCRTLTAFIDCIFPG